MTFSDRESRSTIVRGCVIIEKERVDWRRRFEQDLDAYLEKLYGTWNEMPTTIKTNVQSARLFSENRRATYFWQHTGPNVHF